MEKSLLDNLKKPTEKTKETKQIGFRMEKEYIDKLNLLVEESGKNRTDTLKIMIDTFYNELPTVQQKD